MPVVLFPALPLLALVLLSTSVASAAAEVCTGALEADAAAGVITCTTARAHQVQQLWARSGSSPSTILDSTSFEDTVINEGTWTSTIMGALALRHAVVAGEGAAREGRSVWWQRVKLGASLDLNALAGAALIVRGANRGVASGFTVRDAPSDWQQDAVSYSTVSATWQEQYPNALQYSGVHAYAWHVIDVTQALLAQYPYTGELNLAMEPASDADGPQFWSTRSSVHPPLLVLDWK